MLFKKSFLILKKKFASLFLLELAFVFSLLFFLVFVKDKISGYLALIRGLTPQLAVLQKAAETNIADATALVALSDFQSVTSGALNFAYVVVPLVLFVLWCVFQSSLWFCLKNESLKSFGSFFKKFVVVSLILFGLLYVVLKSILKDVLSSGALDTSFAQIVLLSFVFFYFSLVAFACLSKDPLKKFFKRFLFISFKRVFSVLLPIFLFFSLVFVGFVFLFGPLFLQFWVGGEDRVMVGLVLYLVVLIVVSL